MPWNIAGGGGGTGSLFGQVQSGSGYTYNVVTFSNGPNTTPDNGGNTIVVTILNLLATETIPVNTWIGPIDTVVDSNGNTSGWCTVPTWL